MRLSQKDAATSAGTLAADRITRTQLAEAISPCIILRSLPSRKEFSTTQALFARLGLQLLEANYLSGSAIWTVAKWKQARSFSTWAEVLEFLRKIEA
jgi:hypothetical protein